MMERAGLSCGIVVAAGSSSRMRGTDKKFALLCGKTVLEHSVLALASCAFVGEVVVVTRQEDVERVRALLHPVGKVKAVVPGGATRQRSVLAGIRAAGAGCPFYIIHDAARPLADREDIRRCYEDASRFGAASLCAPVTDTIKERGEEGFIAATHDREKLFACQTPQIFTAGRYRAAAERAIKDGLEFTDDCQLFEHAGFPVRLTVSKSPNPKITLPEDLLTAEALMGKGGKPMYKVGHGYDVHRLAEGRRLILGGVHIPYEKGLLGHSDADVLLHAITDSILGALALGDIGTHFPDSDIAYKDADSLALLARVRSMMETQGFRVGNLDATVVAEAPKLKEYIPSMREKIAGALHVPVQFVSLKATTEEKMGFTGRGEGISATALCLLTK